MVANKNLHAIYTVLFGLMILCITPTTKLALLSVTHFANENLIHLYSNRLLVITNVTELLLTCTYSGMQF